MRGVLLSDSEGKAVYFVPLAAGEVGHHDRHGAVVDGDLGKLYERAPLGGVIDVLIERKTVVEAIDKAIIHDEVHSAVAADLAGKVFDLLNERILVSLHQGVALLVAHELLCVEVVVSDVLKLCATESETLVRIFVGITLSTLNLVHTAVRLRGNYAVFDKDSLSLAGTDEGRGVVAVGVLLYYTLTIALVCLILAGESVGVHRDEDIHLVSAVDIEILADGADAVGRIDVAVVILIIGHTPVSLIVVPVGLEVVAVGAFDVDHLAEQTLLDHIQAGQLEEVVAAVLEHHAMLAGTLGSIDKIPALLDRGSGRDFDGGVFAVFHRIDCDRGVELPGNCEVDEIDIRELAELLVALLAGKLILRAGSAELLEDTLSPLDALGIEVAKGNDSRILKIRETPHGTGSTVAQADKAHADVLDRFGRETEHRLLVRRTVGSIVNDLVTLNLVTIFV
jgi:hypothetical protein